MAQSSEAICLLQTGSSYRERLGLQTADGGEIVFVGFKRGAFSIYFGDEPIYHVDLEGRWQRAYVAGMHYLKALDTATVAVDRRREAGGMVLRRRRLGFAETADLDASIRGAALDLIEGLQTGRLGPIGPPPGTTPIAVDDLLEMLERIARWDPAAWFAHRERYLTTYAPPGFLPPEAQDALILQATIGPHDGLAFGPPPEAGSQVRSLPEFEAHARAVASLLGRRVQQCRRIVLGGRDLLRLEGPQIVGFLQATVRVFPVEPDPIRTMPSAPLEATTRLEGICAFLDRLDPPPDPAPWRHYRSIGLSRIVVGLESGDPAIRSSWGKGWDDDALRALVTEAGKAGIAISLVVLADAGGPEGAEAHESATADLIGSLGLGPGDLVYLVAASEAVGPSASDRLAERGITPWPVPEGPATLRARLAPILAARNAKVALYNPDKNWT